MSETAALLLLRETNRLGRRSWCSQCYYVSHHFEAFHRCWDLSKVADLPGSWYYEAVPVEQFRSMFAFSSWHRGHVAHVDLAALILVGTIRTAGREIQFLLDGMHRVRRALDRKIESLPGRILSVEETAFLETE